jgi:hypothetical protein
VDKLFFINQYFCNISVKQGAKIMTLDQIEGIEPLHENWGTNLGEEIDEVNNIFFYFIIFFFLLLFFYPADKINVLLKT